MGTKLQMYNEATPSVKIQQFCNTSQIACQDLKKKKRIKLKIMVGHV